MSTPPISGSAGAPVFASQFQPYRRGLSTRCRRLARNDHAPVRSTIDRATPRIPVHTGTAVGPRPGSSANRTPTVVLGASRRPDSARVIHGVRSTAEIGRAGWVARHAASVPITNTPAPVSTNPRTITSASTSNPRCSSAVRARPMGINGDARTATATAAVAAIAEISRARATPTSTSSRRSIPSARRTASSPRSRYAWRSIVWPTMKRSATKVRPARRRRAVASRSSVRCTFALWFGRLAMNPTG